MYTQDIYNQAIRAWHRSEQSYSKQRKNVPSRSAVCGQRAAGAVAAPWSMLPSESLSSVAFRLTLRPPALPFLPCSAFPPAALPARRGTMSGSLSSSLDSLSVSLSPAMSGRGYLTVHCFCLPCCTERSNNRSAESQISATKSAGEEKREPRQANNAHQVHYVPYLNRHLRRSPRRNRACRLGSCWVEPPWSAGAPRCVWRRGAWLRHRCHCRSQPRW